MKILKISLITSENGPDKAVLWTDLPPSIAPADSAVSSTLDLRITKGQGKEYLEKNFPGVPIQTYGL